MGKRQKKIENIIEKKIREMPPEKAFEIMLIIMAGIGQYANIKRGTPGFYVESHPLSAITMAAGESATGNPLISKYFILNNEFSKILSSPHKWGKEKAEDILQIPEEERI